jgi:hypothetical protein
MKKMKLSVSINFFNGGELLKHSIFSIRNHVEHISVVWQSVSNFGNKIDNEDYNTLIELKQNGFIDDLIEYDVNLSIKASQNEYNKRMVGLNQAKNINATHFLIMDADEFYKPDEFIGAKKLIESGDIEYSCVRSYFYIHSPRFRSKCTDITNVCFIAKITKSMTFTHNGQFPIKSVDPTRRITNKGKFLFFDSSVICMHHMNFVRKNFDSKLSNTSSRYNKKFILDAYAALDNWRYPQVFEFPNKPPYKIIEVDNIFDISDVNFICKNKVLITSSFLMNFSGSELAVLDLAVSFINKGYSVTIASFIFESPIINKLNKLPVKMINIDELNDDYFDIIWSQHFTTIDYIILDTNVTYGKIIHSCLSPYMPIESLPICINNLSWIIANSFETKNSIVGMGVSKDSIFVLPNPVLDSFFKKNVKITELKKLLIVSNHIPDELYHTVKSLKKHGVTVDIVGYYHKHVEVTSELIIKYDAVISIGRTVQYCLSAGVPIYCYDRFGGPGWILPSNIKNSGYYNFSGRCINRQLSHNQLSSEVINGFSNAVSYIVDNKKYAYKNFNLNNLLDEILITNTDSPIEYSDNTMYAISIAHRKYYEVTELNSSQFKKLLISILKKYLSIHKLRNKLKHIMSGFRF